MRQLASSSIRASVSALPECGRIVPGPWLSPEEAVKPPAATESIVDPETDP